MLVPDEKKKKVYNLKPNVYEFTLVDAELQTPQDYELRTFSGERRAKWLNFTRSRSKLTEDGLWRTTDFTDIEATLLTWCMWRLKTGPKGVDELVDIEFARSIPAPIMVELYDEAMIICGLMPKAIEAEKNS